MYKKNNQKGFTLIELLIVIVIIGILAGVLIAIIDPATQQNRAKDAGVQASMNKIALATQGFISAYGYAPDAAEFMGSVDNVNNVTACAAADTTCTFNVTGNAAPSLCLAANDWNTDGTAVCTYYYVQDPTGAAPSHFRLAVRSYGLAGQSYVFDNVVGQMNKCDYDDTDDAGGSCEPVVN